MLHRPQAPRRFRGIIPAEQAARMTAGEVRAAIAAGYRPGIAGADPLKDKLTQVDGHITELRQDAGEKWKALETAKADVGKVEGQITPESPEFKALDEAGKAYGTVQDQIAAAEQVKAGLVDNLTRAGVVTPQGPAKGEGPRMAPGQRESAGQRITAGEAYAQVKASGKFGSSGRFGEERLGEGWTRDETKALLRGADDVSGPGVFVDPDRVGYFPLAMRPLTLFDLITIGDTDSDLIEYVRMTSFTNAAAETPEAVSAAPIAPRDGSVVTAVQGGRKPESSMEFEKVQEAVSTIAHWVPATKRSLADAGQLRTIVDGMLSWGLDDRLERQLVSGDGLGDNLLGLLNHPINSVDPGPASHADKVHFGITAIRLDNHEPTGVGIHPTNWETIRLSREDGANGAYLFGPPSAQGAQTLWGKPVVVSASFPLGTAVVGAFRALVFWLREGTQIVASDSHEDFFTRNLVAILAEMRGGSGIPLPQAFAEVDLAAA
jgi:HK97 family phage major capsid protein